MKVLFLSQKTEWCRIAQRFLQQQCDDLLILEGERGEPLPEAAREWSGDALISFLSLWVVPSMVLERARQGSFNFHPGPPEYPGIGCYNFALYEEAKMYGVTCHRMAKQVDSGDILKVHRFPILPSDTVASLKERSLVSLLHLFMEMTPRILAGEPIKADEERWSRRPFTRQELDELCRITPEMTEREIHRRVRATTYPGFPGPYVELAGHIFKA